MLRKTPRIVASLFIGDLLILVAAFSIGYYFRFLSVFARPAAYVPTLSEFSGALLLILLVWLVVCAQTHVYRSESVLLSDEWGRLTISLAVTYVLFLALLFVYRDFWFSRQVVFIAGIISLAGIAKVRLLLFYGQRILQKSGLFRRSAIILGKGEEGDHIVRLLNERPELGIQVILQTNQMEDVHRLLGSQKAEEVFIADRTLPNNVLLDLITEYSLKDVQFRIVPGILDLLATRVTLGETGEIPLLTIGEVGLRGVRALTKRAFDIWIAFIALVITLPITTLVGLLIPLSSRGPIFIRQERIGQNGRPFQMLKFRSMVVGAEDVESVLRGVSSPQETTFKLRTDPRVTPVGKTIRRLSIDELPQLVNVLRGEMSLVGPRPGLPHEIEKYSNWEKKRLRVRPGMTGLWQVSGRSDLGFTEMVKLDLFYIENWSIWMDLKILLRTVPSVIMGKGAY